jgi:putative protease
MTRLPQLICPAGSLPALKASVDNGADTVYVGFKNATNARNFAGLNFTDTQLAEGIRYAQSRGREVLIAINTFAQAGRIKEWHASIDRAAELGADAGGERLGDRLLRGEASGPSLCLRVRGWRRLRWRFW